MTTEEYIKKAVAIKLQQLDLAGALKDLKAESNIKPKILKICDTSITRIVREIKEKEDENFEAINEQIEVIISDKELKNIVESLV